ncbi:MAG TPA: fused MFS/spermidine synthase [Patescibacteria group bacterium]|nr:fused MFS/spermidine synthase [Patescibacteria group bacterium]
MIPPRLCVPLYSLTLLLSAFLLFSVQPLLGKMILPLLGGAPAVWNTAMVFFQAALLAGYAYAHLTSRLTVGRQALVHFLVLAACAAALPIAIPAVWKTPPVTGYPVFWQLAMMAVVAGGPFFAISATAPLLQRWFTFTGHRDAANPYFLYAASNLGSMAALLLYPFAIEPHLAVHEQTRDWAGLYGLLIICIIACAFIAAKGRALPEVAETTPDAKVSRKQLGLWLLLGFLPSSLMLGVTTYITTDIASVPLLWIVPLALYTGSFIIAFARRPPVKLEAVTLLQGIVLAAAIALAVNAYTGDALISFVPAKISSFSIHLLLFFLSSLMCNMQLAQAQPAARHLTMYYLAIAAGGVAGGVFNALLAPVLFPLPIEYALALGALVLLRYRGGESLSLGALRRWLMAEKFGALAWKASLVTVVAWLCFINYDQFPAKNLMYLPPFALAALALLSRQRWLFALCAIAMLVVYPDYMWQNYRSALAWQRNFFGTLWVMQIEDVRFLMFNTTMHGAESVKADYIRIPLSYYAPNGPAGDVFEILNKRPGEQKIAQLGLGVGTITCYALPRRSFDIYEIDPDVVKIAQDPRLFAYLKGCGASYKIIMGDARLKLAAAPDHSYDLIFVDTFSSDNIPVHMMTKEAFSLYFSKLKPGGLVVVHLSNRYLNLTHVVSAIARDFHVYIAFGESKSVDLGDGLFASPSLYAVMTARAPDLQPFIARHWILFPSLPSWKSWSDDYSDIVSAISVWQKFWKEPDKSAAGSSGK